MKSIVLAVAVLVGCMSKPVDVSIHTSYDALVASASAVNQIEHAQTEAIIAHAQQAGELHAQVTAEVSTWRATVDKVDAVIDAGFEALKIAIKVHDDKSIGSLTTAAIEAVSAVSTLRKSIEHGSGVGSGSGGK